MTADRRARLSDAVSALDGDGYLLDASTSDPNQRYVAGFEARDPFVSLVTAEGVFQLFWGVDHETARSVGFADEVSHASDFGYTGYGDADAQKRVVRRFVRNHGVETVAVPERFPVGTTRALEPDVTVTVADSDPLTDLRARKSVREVDRIRTAAGAADAALDAVASLLADASATDGDVTIGGDPVTGQDAETRVTEVLSTADCSPAAVAVASGADTADPHGETAGVLDANAPIVVDVVPREPDGYHADVCRTFCVGDPPEQVQDGCDLVRDALDAAAGVIGPGATAAEVNDALCTAFEDDGVPTPRSDPDADAGALHYMAHGVGLTVHEAPFCTPDSDATLEPGVVLSVEPAIYNPTWGGVRVEDVFHVAADGARRLSTADRGLVPV